MVGFLLGAIDHGCRGEHGGYHGADSIVTLPRRQRWPRGHWGARWDFDEHPVAPGGGVEWVQTPVGGRGRGVERAWRNGRLVIVTEFLPEAILHVLVGQRRGVGDLVFQNT